MDLNNKRVLIAEDDTYVRETIASMIEELGATHIFLAPNGQIALDIIQKHYDQIDLIISDWNMPIFKGIQILKFLNKRHMKLPFVMISANKEEDVEQEAFYHKANAFLNKPFSFMAFQDTIKKVSKAF